LHSPFSDQYIANMLQKPYIVGITGGSASGKTAFLESLRHHFLPNELCLISQDNYYRAKAQQPLDENGQINYDLPECIDDKQFAQDISRLHAGESISQEKYLFQLEDGMPQTITLEPAPILVVEGLFIFHFSEIASQLDLKIFIDASDEVKLKRRMERDTKERGVPAEHVHYQWEHHVLPAFNSYLLPYRESADIIVNNNKHFRTSLELLKDHFYQKLNS